MVTVYTITINNDSGEDRRYALFTEPPQVAAGGIKPIIWSNVFGRANAAHSTRTEFKITKQYYAVFGSSSGTPGEGVDVMVSGTKKVDLGKLNKDKTEVKGTTLNYVVKDGIPQFDDGDHPNQGQVQAFNITTDEFNASQAKKDHFFIGLAGSAQGIGPNAGPCAIFTPEPNADYQIQPSSKFYVAFGDFKEGEIIDYVKKSKNACLVDFTKLDHAGTTDVVINHDSDNIMTIQADS